MNNKRRREKEAEENSWAFGESLDQLLSPSCPALRQIIFYVAYGRDENDATKVLKIRRN